MKKLLSTILASTMILSAATASFAVEFTPTATENTAQNPAQTMSTSSYSGSCGDNATYSFNSATGTMTISGTGELDRYGTNTNQMKMRPWNDYVESITKLVVGDGITTIGTAAFYRCTALASVSLPQSLNNIQAYAFSGCSSLTSIDIPPSVNEIGQYAFSSCSSLTSFVIPDAVTTVSKSLFQGCTHALQPSSPQPLGRPVSR